MSDIRCPMCGKPNPAEVEVCKFCQARLKPLIIQPQPPQPAAQPPQPAPKKEDEVDWLRGLAGDVGAPAAEEPGPSASPEPAGEEPDWLARIRQKTREEQDAVSPIGRPPRIDSQPAPSQSVSGNTPAGGQSGGGDWLQSLRGAGQTDELPASPENEPLSGSEPAASSAGQDLDNDEWLRSFGARLGNSGAPVQPTSAPDEQAAAQRLSQLTSQAPTVPASQPPAPGNVAPPPLSSSPALDADVPDWLQSFASVPPDDFGSPPAASEPPAALPADMPDWLKSFAAEQPAAIPQPKVEQPAAAAQEAAPSEETPDWLRAFGSSQPTAGPVAEQPAVEQSIETPQETAPVEETPDWLSSFASSLPVSGPAAEQPPAKVPPEAVPAEETSDWLKAFAQDQSAPAQEAVQPAAEQPAAAAEPEAQPAEGIPDWLKSFTPPAPPAAEIPAAPAEKTPAEEPAPAEGIPDWLKKFTSSPPVIPEIPAGEETAASSVFLLPGSQVTPAEPQPGATPAEEIPDWLKTYSEKEAQPESEPAPEAPAAPEYVSPFSTVDLPQWMAFDQAAPAAEPAPPEPKPGSVIGRAEKELAGPAGSFAGEDMTHWLDHSAEEPAAQAETGSEAGSEGLEEAQLPAWLQAMRPVESAMPAGEENVNDQRVEKSGPLAGLRGVLRGEDLVTQYQKPPAYSVKLRVTEPQTLRATMLEGLIVGESKPQAVPADSILAPQMVVRVATGLALIGLILIVILFGPHPVSTIGISPSGQKVFNTINGLTPGAPVLVAVEYQGGLSGELRIAAAPVLQHAMAHTARLAFISTQPEGPVLAEALFSAARSGSAASYPVELKANLGYLLGGSTALKALTARPLSESLPQLWGSGAAWSQPALQGLKQITDFSQVIVITDTPEAARDWIEQVQPVLAARKIPLLVISSAQAAPMLQPYQTSGQITGLLSGLTGGAAYEQLVQQPGNGTGYWNAYLAGILAVILFILLGGIVSLFSNALRPNTKPKA